MAKLHLVAIALLLPLAGAAVLAFSLSRDAEAAGPCGTPDDAMNSEEFAFLGLLQQWRDDPENVPNSDHLTPSGPLNAAAAWFAQYQVDHQSPGGHYDGMNRYFDQRAIDCGWPYPAGLGEGIAAYIGQGDITGQVSSQGALDLMASEPGSGIYAWDTSSSPWSFKCTGVGIAVSDDSSAVAWVVLIAEYPANQDCPDIQTQPIDSASSPSPTESPTNTPSPTPTSTPTPIPTPDSWRSWALDLTAE